MFFLSLLENGLFNSIGTVVWGKSFNLGIATKLQRVRKTNKNAVEIMLMQLIIGKKYFYSALVCNL